MSSILTEALCEDFNPDLFLTDPDLTASYARDRTGSYFGLPLAVARPRATEDVAAIMVRCAELNLRVVPQGGLTGLVGAAVSDANEPEIVVLLDHALAIEIDPDEPLHVLQAQEQAAGCDYGRERMAGAGNADGDVLLRGRMHERSQFVFGTRLRLVPGDEGLVANPIAPVAARPQLRRRLLRHISHAVVPLDRRTSPVNRLTPKKLCCRAPLPLQVATWLCLRAEAISASNSSSRSIVTGFTRW